VSGGIQRVGGGVERGGAMVDAERKGQALMSQADKKCRTVGHLFGSLFPGQVTT